MMKIKTRPFLGDRAIDDTIPPAIFSTDGVKYQPKNCNCYHRHRSM